MAQPTIIWTFLPNGIEKGLLRFTAFPSFRLPEESGKSPNLSLFPDILNWTETLKAVEFTVEIEKGPVLRVKRTSPEPDGELWKAIFQPDAPITPFRFTDWSKRAVIAFPARNVMTFLAQQYITTAVDSPEKPPTIQTMLRPEALGQIRMKPITRQGFAPLAAVKTESAMHQQMRKTLDTQKVRALPVSNVPSPADDFFLVRLFHQPRNKTVMNPVTKQMVVARAPIKPPEIDFHQAVALIAQYPALMRLLGLAIDFEAPIPAAMARTGNARIVPGDRKDQTPWTRFMYEGPRQMFYTASRSPKPPVVDGFLNLADDEDFDIVQIDLDGAAIKAAALSDEAESKHQGELAALRSGGLAVVRTGQAVTIATAVKAAADNNALLEGRRPITFFAEDLIQGYRVDVWDDRGKKWNSLCKRSGTYSFTRIKRDVTLDDEGYVSSNVTQAADGSSEDLFTHESLFCWEGWSLVAPRPGKTIDPEDNARDIQNSAATAFRLETRFKPAAGSLPRLRFGSGYRLRARAVDLAGNSVGPDAAGDAQAIPAPAQPPHVYSRFDPIAAPVVVLREAAKRGESLDHVVIRSFNDAEPKDVQPTAEAADRHVAPPKTAQLNAEIHGQFDIAKGLNPDSYALICAKDGGAFHDVEPNEVLPLPYLPDPWAKGVTVRGLPHQPGGKPMQIEFTGDWPEAKLLRLRVVEGENPPVWDPSTRVLTIALKKSETATLTLSSYLNEDKLPHLGLYRWLEQPQRIIPSRLLQISGPPVAKVQTGKVQASKAQAQPVERAPLPQAAGRVTIPAVDINVIKAATIQGLHWMMTPYREMTLIHAVQQPIGRPASARFEALKTMGATFATLDAELGVHGDSTAKIDLLADWDEPLDNVQEPSWRTISGKAHVFELPLARGLTSLVLDPAAGHRHEFGDTKYRKVIYHVAATSRYREQMPQEIADDPAKITRTSDAIEVAVPNSAPPAIPGVLYVIPTFGWERKRQGNTMTSVRTGGGLRVYLERPWFSSGDGELLAAVLPTEVIPTAVKPGLAPAKVIAKPGQPGKTTPMVARPAPAVSRQAQAAAPKTVAVAPVPDSFKPYITQWGIDPLWRSGDTPTHAYPRPEDFKTAVETQTNLLINELPGLPRFTAVGHEVKYDEERRLWYCDIEFGPQDAYYPFVRLALARFQPNSIPGAHLSRIVLADFIQLAPDRAVSVAFDKANARSLTVSVSGVSYIQTAAEGGPAEIEAGLETQSPEIPGELGWAAVPNTVVALKAQRLPNLAPGHFAWVGKVNMPTARGTRPYRLAIREYETFTSDEIDKSAMTTAAIPKKVRRLVFAETIEL